MTKCVTGINMHGDRIRKIDKRNTTAVFPMCFENKNWDHVIKCCKNKDNRDKWGKYLRNKIERTEQHKKADEEEKRHVKEMMEDTNKYLNNEDYYLTNQQLIGYKDMFKRAIFKDWVVGNSNSVKFHLHNKVWIEHCVKHYHEFQKRSVALYSPDVQKKVSK